MFKTTQQAHFPWIVQWCFLEELELYLTFFLPQHSCSESDNKTSPSPTQVSDNMNECLFGV